MASLETLVVPIVAGSEIGGNIFALLVALLTILSFAPAVLRTMYLSKGARRAILAHMI